MILVSKRLQLFASAAVLIGALIKIFHLHSSGDYLLFAGCFTAGTAGIIEFIYSSEKNFNSITKLIASIIICLAIISDLTFATSTFPFAIVILAVSFFGSALPQQKISK